MTGGGIWSTIDGPAGPPEDRIIDRITPHRLWVGHSGDGGDARRLHEAGIEAVVQVAAEQAPLSPPRSLLYHRFPIADGAGNPPEILILAVGAVEALVRLGVPTLVCCGMGRSRSPAVAAAGLARALGISPDEALRLVARSRPLDVAPDLWAEVRAIPARAPGGGPGP